MPQYDPQGGYTTADLLPGIEKYESGGRQYAVSPKGAIGLYQIMPETAGGFGVQREQLFDPETNRNVASKYLDQLLAKYNGNAYLALAAYNAGPANVDRGYIPPETIDYVHNVLGYTSGRQIGQKQRGIRQEPPTAGTPLMFSSRSAPPPEQPDPSFISNSLLSGLFGRGSQPTGGKWPGEGELTTVPQKSGDVFGSSTSSGPSMGKLFQTLMDAIPKSTPVQAISPDPGEVTS